MSLLPESGKPIDLDITAIKTAPEARMVLKWLDALITNMQHQILQHLLGPEADEQWLARVRAALRATIHTRFKVGEIEISLDRTA